MLVENVPDWQRLHATDELAPASEIGVEISLQGWTLTNAPGTSVRNGVSVSSTGKNRARLRAQTPTNLDLVFKS